MFIWEGIEYENYTFDYTTNQLIRKCGKPLNINIFSTTGYKYYSLYQNGKTKKILLHRLFYQFYHPDIDIKGLLIDHIDRNPLNNNLNNLRIATKSDNALNQPKRKNTSSKYIGVCWNKNKKKWQSQITVNYKNNLIGLFNSEREAAIAYNNYIINNNLNNGFRQLNVIEPKKKVACIKKTNP